MPSIPSYNDYAEKVLERAMGQTALAKIKALESAGKTEDDMERAKTFYESVFQVELQRLNTPELEMWAFPMAMDKVGAGGTLVKMAGVSSGGCSTLVYDTEGNVIGLHSMT